MNEYVTMNNSKEKETVFSFGWVLFFLRARRNAVNSITAKIITLKFINHIRMNNHKNNQHNIPSKESLRYSKNR